MTRDGEWQRAMVLGTLGEPVESKPLCERVDGEYTRVVDVWQKIGDNLVSVPPPIREPGFLICPWDMAPYHTRDLAALPQALSPTWDMHEVEP